MKFLDFFQNAVSSRKTGEIPKKPPHCEKFPQNIKPIQTALRITHHVREVQMESMGDKMKRLYIHIIAAIVTLMFLSASFAQARQTRNLLSNINYAAYWIGDPANNLARMVELAKTDHIALIKWGLANYHKTIRNYAGILHKQERINGRLKKTEKIRFWFRETPYSIMMKWKENPNRVDKLLYVEGQNNNNMIVHPTGNFAWLKSVKRKPRCKDAIKTSLRTCDQFGFYKSMESALKMYKLAEEENRLQMKYLGKTIINGRQCITVQANLDTKQNSPRAKIVMSLDCENVLPLSIEYYDSKNNLLSKYSFSDLKLNARISEKTFIADTHKM